MKFKILSLLTCIFLLIGCVPNNTGEKYTLIVRDASPTLDGEYVQYTLISTTREETIESATTDPLRPSMSFADEYGKFNIGDTLVIIKK